MNRLVLACLIADTNMHSCASAVSRLDTSRGTSLSTALSTTLRDRWQQDASQTYLLYAVLKRPTSVILSRPLLEYTSIQSVSLPSKGAIELHRAEAYRIQPKLARRHEDD